MTAQSVRSEHPLSFRDAIVAAVLCVVAAGISYRGFAQFPDQIYAVPYLDVWFDSDPPRVIGNLTSSLSNARASVHPAFLLIAYPMGQMLALLGMTPGEIAATYVLTCSALSTLFLYLGLRGLGLPIAAATTFTGVFLAS